jgi:hypothetical protein
LNISSPARLNVTFASVFTNILLGETSQAVQYVAPAFPTVRSRPRPERHDFGTTPSFTVFRLANTHADLALLPASSGSTASFGPRLLLLPLQPRRLRCCYLCRGGRSPGTRMLRLPPIAMPNAKRSTSITLRPVPPHVERSPSRPSGLFSGTTTSTSKEPDGLPEL